MKTFYMPGYDIETERCIKGVRSIASQHKKYSAPATFFILGELLENKEWTAELKSLIDDELFDIQSHTYSHILLKSSDGCECGTELSKINEEIKKTNELIFSIFGRKVIGIRSPCGFEHGIKGEVELQHTLWHNGIRFVSSQLVGKHNTVPAPLSTPFRYEEDDILRPLLEMPAHDWHDNVLKGYNFCPVGWPPTLPWGYPERPPQTPIEEFEVYKKGIDYAIKQQMIYYSPCMHPWSIYRFNKDAETINLILEYLKQEHVEICNFKQMYNMIENQIIDLY